MSESDHTREKQTPAKAAEELGARAAEIYKDTRPKVDKLVTRARPGVEKAGQQAARYVREHEQDIKRAAGSVARYRLLPGPLRLVVDALRPEAASPQASICASCKNANPPTAKFCNQCGERLAPETSLQH